MLNMLVWKSGKGDKGERRKGEKGERRKGEKGKRRKRGKGEKGKVRTNCQHDV